MSIEEILRDQNFQLKNQITDLKNAFDLNRDILKILSTHNFKNDPQHQLFFQIITRLTNVNNQTMLYCVQLIQQRNIVKQQNFKLNQQMHILEQRLEQEIQKNITFASYSEAKILMQEQINNLNKQLMAANEERILLEQHDRFRYQSKNIKQHTTADEVSENIEYSKHKQIKRKYFSNPQFKIQRINLELQKQIRKLKLHIEQLEYRLTLFIKSYNLQDELISYTRRQKERQRKELFRQSSRSTYLKQQEVRLLKYALNKIQLEIKEDQYILSITQRFQDKRANNIGLSKDNRSYSWPLLKPLEQDQQIVRNAKIEERDQQY